MGISHIELRNCLSLVDIKMDISSLTCLIGANGTGKSNILRAIQYYYDNLTSNNNSKNLHDINNPFCPFFEITIYYDFSKLLTISKNQFLRKFSFDKNELNPLFYKILSIKNENYLDKNNLLKVTLREYRNKKQEWNIPYEMRAFIKHMFPIYFIETRKINLTDWDDLWEIIGDLSKFSNFNKREFESDLESLFTDIFGKNYSKIVKTINTTLRDSNLRVEPSSISGRFGTIYQLQTGGRKFNYRNENLDVFSDGINSFNYLKILIMLVNRISIAKLKEPTIIIDEPEISLYPKFIDELAEIICSKNKKLNIFLVTHSPRLIRNLINFCDKHNIYHTTINNNYTALRRMSSFGNKGEIVNLTELEASFYFSKGIVILEGKSDLQVLKNKNIKKLFPFLKEFDYYSLDSNTVNLELIHPDNKNINIPYVVVLDFDQIIQYDQKDKKFNLRSKSKWFNPLKDNKTFQKELYTFGKRRIKTFHYHKRIKGILEKCNFPFDYKWGLINDNLFKTLNSLIKDYCLGYNIFLFNSTLEGALININNYQLFFNWFSATYPKQVGIFNKFNLKNLQEKVTLLRLFFGGKFDNLNTVEMQYGKQLIKITNQPFKDLINELLNYKIGKTRWIDNFFDYFFENYIDNLPNPTDKIKVFKDNFPEIYNLINVIKNKL